MKATTNIRPRSSKPYLHQYFPAPRPPSQMFSNNKTLPSTSEASSSHQQSHSFRLYCLLATISQLRVLTSPVRSSDLNL
ncbi:hypothetical protein K443DRAFT_685819 [Laccaria amethystina LaAM-08-1]|uniref:Uncharacterized protein n=1 Tax=Laccaria amethystina LaAM-08-1 TaxID=1095629 RepID=A0A0C9WHS1_9AGAR|nr:hypothetical protein K443DRAFT_685819 [Laccaria amethystina LaAM-08-1]